MSEIVEAFRVGVPSVVVPLTIFGINWAFRERNGYAQTAAADFILAVLIFDGVAVVAAKEFEPFINNPELQSIVGYWHMTIAALGALLLYFILKWGEPRVARYYQAKRQRPRFPIFTMMFCWAAVFALISAHIGFFVIRGLGHG